MNRLQHALVWLSRIAHCRGFGIQSPTDYQFVRYVVNEHWPYYAYAHLGTNDHWPTRKLGRLYFRLANWRQPSEIVDGLGVSQYLQAGCRRARVVGGSAAAVQMALKPIEADLEPVIARCTRNSLLVVEGIWRNKTAWQRVVADARVGTTFDLYYCGIAMFDTERFKHNYTINF